MAAHQLPLEEAMPWLPSQVLDEACDIKVYMRQRHHYHHIQQPPFLHRQRPHHRPLLSPSDFALSLNEKSKYSNICSRPNQKQKPASNWTAGGQGMQAIFLDSGRQLGGTGVFLPRGTGGSSNYQPNQKPACSMVLVPARVVKALNLDVQALGLQISPRKEAKNNQKGRECNNSIVKNKKGKDITSTHCSFMSQNQTNSSQDIIFLPKEWTY
ncbi:hypothetical protein IC575_002330 [Cucumis melo]|uniref:Uncharacterized protein LOC103492680 n=1 Tax=Cucumis melo TaxID=3656 RepID=A0A1S3BS46_CUCME|nr:uncharacterized protein LOC103492680 [Cucumis melo]